MSTEEFETSVKIFAWKMNDENKRTDKYELFLENGTFSYGIKFNWETKRSKMITIPDEIPDEIASTSNDYGINKVLDQTVDDPEQKKSEEVESKIEITDGDDVYKYTIWVESVVNVLKNGGRIGVEEVPKPVQAEAEAYIPDFVET